jgi:hypothetical protein
VAYLPPQPRDFVEDDFCEAPFTAPHPERVKQPRLVHGGAGDAALMGQGEYLEVRAR